MDNLAKMTGSMAIATTVAGPMASNVTAQGLVSETDERLTIEDVTYPGAKGEMKGNLAIPRTRQGCCRR
jgi:carboxymethylenebutenolidase